MSKNKVIQFEVWNECNNKCAFCSNRYVYRLSDAEKLKMLAIVKNKIEQSSLYECFDTIALIGGEFFQGQLANFEVRSYFYDIVNIINDKLNAGILSNFWITATLTFENQDDLWSMLNIIDDKSKVWICTSYDTSGRFHTNKLKTQWMKNVAYLKKHYPTVNVNVTTILTGSFIDEYLSDEFSISAFTRQHRCSWFNKPPMVPQGFGGSKLDFNTSVLNNFFPQRDRFLQFLLKFKQRESEFEYDKLFNMELRSDEFVRIEDDHLAVTDRDKSQSAESIKHQTDAQFLENSDECTIENVNGSCGHNNGYTPYVDSDACFFCDKEMIKSL